MDWEVQRASRLVNTSRCWEGDELERACGLLAPSLTPYPMPFFHLAAPELYSHNKLLIVSKVFS